MLIVIPTSRSVSLEYLQPLIDFGARFIVVDDSEGSVKIDHPQFSIYTWKDQDHMLGGDVIASLGATALAVILVSTSHGGKSDAGEIVIALDDDCKIEDHNFCQRVEAVLSDAPRPVAMGAGVHFDVLDCYSNTEDNIFPRGFPYSHRATYRKWKFGGRSSGVVNFNLGLWREIFDVNAIDKIQGPKYCYPDAELHHESVVVPHGALISVCSMNMQFRREVLPAVYQLLMHINVMPGWVIDRYGDIWGGFILKMLMDIKGDLMATGAPMISTSEGGFASAKYLARTHMPSRQ